MWYFSPTTRGFYSDHDITLYTNSMAGWPVDAVAITDSEYIYFTTTTPPPHYRVGISSPLRNITWVPFTPEELKQDTDLRRSMAIRMATDELDTYRTLLEVRPHTEDESRNYRFYQTALTSMYDNPGDITAVNSVLTRRST